MKKRKTSKKMSKKKSNTKKPKSPSALQGQDLIENQEKSVLLDLVIKRIDGVDDVYLLDAIELGGLLVGPDKFIEIPTRKTPGIRFVTLRYHDEQ